MEQMEKEASKMACQITRERLIERMRLENDDMPDDYIIEYHSFEYNLFMSGWKFAQIQNH